MRAKRNRAQLARINGSREVTFVLDGQQRLTSLLVGLQGTYVDRKTKGGRGARKDVAKKLFLDLLHDGTAADAEGAIYYHFDFFDYAPSLLAKDSYWFEVGRILRIDSADNHGQGGAKGENGLKALVDRQVKAIRDIRPLTTAQACIVEHNLRRLHESISVDQSISYHTETHADHERILEIFVRANSGGTPLTCCWRPSRSTGVPRMHERRSTHSSRS